MAELQEIDQQEVAYLEDGRRLTWQLDPYNDHYNVLTCNGLTVIAKVHCSVPVPLLTKFLDYLSVYAPSQIIEYQGTGARKEPDSVELDIYEHQLFFGISEPVYDIQQLYGALCDREPGWYVVDGRYLISPANTRLKAWELEYMLEEFYIGFPTEVEALSSEEVPVSKMVLQRVNWFLVASSFFVGAIAGAFSMFVN